MRRHEPDLVSFIFGLFFVGAAAIWGLSRQAGHPVRGWALPALLIVVGAVGLLASMAVHRNQPDTPDALSTPPPPDTAYPPGTPGPLGTPARAVPDDPAMPDVPGGTGSRPDGTDLR